ncbi:MAG: efflux RND transporter periplasmic adaptor subunit [Pseudomonadota bacterium]
MIQRILIGLVALILAAAAVWFFFLRGGGDTAGLQIETAALEERDIARVVSASGSIAPLITVEVGSQLSGQVMELGADFNDVVEAGQLIARIDPQTFETRVNEATASQEVASAQVTVAEANLARAEADLREAERAFERTSELLERGTFSQAQFDTAETRLEGARAAVSVAEANIRNSRAALQQRTASLNSARVDLERTFIRSPISGVVIDRQIDVGQTVAASFNAPVLFIIAQDLSRIQIEAQVDESDIGRIAVGQTVSFDVDAYPGDSFEGEVSQVRLAAATTNNVVTYTVVIEADNPRGRLLPGMTANAEIVTGRAEGVLTAPNSALRFRPRGGAEALVAERATPQQSGRGGRGGGRGGGMDAMIDRLAEQLDMTEEQKDQTREELSRAFQRMRAQAQAGGGGGRPDFQGMMRQALQRVLTDEQSARLDEVMSARGGGQGERAQPGTVWVRTEDGRLAERAVRIGLSDGQFSELRGGEFEAGDEVVTRVRETAQ